MTEKLKISVITVSYNQGRFIEENILSVLNQNYENFEHIIIDACSKDNTLDILKKYDHLKWTSEPDKGQSDGLNKGFRKATGDLIVWLNSDDVMCEGAFDALNIFFTENPDKHVVTGNQVIINGKSEIDHVIKNFALKLLAVSFGAIVYYVVIQAVLTLLKVDSQYLKMMSALIVAIFLTIPNITGHKHKKKKPAKEAHHA